MNVDPVFGCRPCVVPSYVRILTELNDGRKTATELGNILRETSSGVGDKVKVLKNLGFVYKVFGGNCRYVVITEEGKEFLKTWRGAQ